MQFKSKNEVFSNYSETNGTARDWQFLFVKTGVCYNRVNLCTNWPISLQILFVITECSLTTEFVITEFHCILELAKILWLKKTLTENKKTVIRDQSEPDPCDASTPLFRCWKCTAALTSSLRWKQTPVRREWNWSPLLTKTWKTLKIGSLT